MEEKKQLIEEIKKLIVVNEEDSIDINPNFLQYFEVDELNSIKSDLEVKKRNISKTSLDFLDKLYEKTKKDKI
ncbi:hypothetical protein CPU12_01660 [Malaciobacter molluscorum LMG 25693]|uniref:Uncharacterized protein n=1 Tax=Malaciobacter molluscorum LMG 25693 TaxID=870501 RepID=A0A2G1DKE6_9BACT|nr:hypothetical protein [Malaciobacter molluscorum]AXX92553.1 hypothetical protein AMOL_1584 [Malaciobacter molluscorum LMG 25693]PHO18978.1 hypothetical protein CPU12_01660 [Malaciobacter molluscorum LMG 25693]